MKNEAEFKSLFKKSVFRYKGFSMSLAAPMIAGIPDLYVVMPGYMPVLMEAKWLGEISRAKFSRKVPFSEIQLIWIRECHEVNPYTALGLVGCIYDNKIHAILTVYGTPQFYQLSNCFLNDCAYSIVRAETKVFDVPHMFSKVPIPRLERRKYLVHGPQGSYLTFDNPNDPPGSEDPLAL